MCTKRLGLAFKFDFKYPIGGSVPVLSSLYHIRNVISLLQFILMFSLIKQTISLSILLHHPHFILFVLHPAHSIIFVHHPHFIFSPSVRIRVFSQPRGTGAIEISHWVKQVNDRQNYQISNTNISLVLIFCFAYFIGCHILKFAICANSYRATTSQSSGNLNWASTHI